MVAENRRVPTLSNLSPCSWYLTLFEDKQGSKSGGIDIWCFIHLVYMLFNWFSSLYRVFLVLFESLQIWSCIGWEMDQLEQKRQQTVQFGDFHAEQSWWLFWIAEQPEWLFRVSVPEIFKETTTYFGICPNLSIFSPSRLWLWYIIFSVSLYHTTLVYREEPDPKTPLLDLLIVKGEGSLHSWEESWTLSLLFNWFSMFSSSVISVFSVAMAE